MDNPKGYKRIQDPIGFEIGVDGKVTVNNHPNVPVVQEVSMAETIRLAWKWQMKVKAQVHCQEPGIMGSKDLFLIASILTIVGVVIAGIYLYKGYKGALLETPEKWMVNKICLLLWTHHSVKNNKIFWSKPEGQR